jgi:hypothetical protein
MMELDFQTERACRMETERDEAKAGGSWLVPAVAASPVGGCHGYHRAGGMGKEASMAEGKAVRREPEEHGEDNLFVVIVCLLLIAFLLVWLVVRGV